MKARALFVAVFASVLMVPVSCSIALVPMTRLLSRLDARDLQAGDVSHLAPPDVVLVDATQPDEPVVVAVDEVRARIAENPSLAPLVGRDGGFGQNDDRYLWRQVGTDGAGREMELVRVSENYTHTFRYRVAADGTITPLRSQLFSVGHMFQAMVWSFLLAAAIHFFALRAKRRAAVRAEAPGP